MALILTSHDLSTGKGVSSEVSNINDKWRITAKTTGCPDLQEVRIDVWVAGEDGNYAPLLKGDLVQSFTLTGNQTRTFGIEDVNATSGKIVAYGKTGQVGSITVDSVTSAGTSVVSIADESGNALDPSGTPVSVAVELTRPADTTAYTANDAINSVVAVAQVDTLTLTGTSGTADVTGTGGLTKTATYTQGTAQVDTITLTGTSGTATVDVAGGLTKTATFNTDLTTTASDFVTAFAADYLAVGITLTSSGADLIFTATDPGTAFSSPTITNATGDLAGTVDNTTPNVTDLAATAAAFVSANSAAYSTEGVTVTSSGEDIIFTASVAGVSFTSPVITTTDGDLSGTVVNTTANVTPGTLEFANMAVAAGGGGYLNEIKLESNITDLASKTIRVWLFKEAPANVQSDNVAFQSYYADKDKRLFYVDVTFDALLGSSDTVIGSSAVTDASLAMREYVCTSTSVFAALQAISAFTPTSGGKINVTLNSLKLN